MCKIKSLFQEILRCCQQLFPTKIQLIEEILRDFVRLEPEAVEIYAERERSAVVTGIHQTKTDCGNFVGEPSSVTRRRRSLRRAGVIGGCHRNSPIRIRAACRSMPVFRRLHKGSDRLQSQMRWMRGIRRDLRGLRGRPICQREFWSR